MIEKIFKEFGGAIGVAAVTLLLIGLCVFLVSDTGIVGTSFSDLVKNFFKTSTEIAFPTTAP